MRSSVFKAALIFSLMPVMSNAELNTNQQIEVMQTGRYSYVKNVAPADQLNPLKVVIKTRIPQTVKTVREATEFLLVRSGYVIADESVLSEEAKVVLGHELPAIHRRMGPMTLDVALGALFGDAFQLVVDPVHRKVAFELSEKLVRAKR